MYLTTNNKIKSDVKLAIANELCKASKNIYNKTLYTVRQHFFKTQEYLSYPKAYPLIKDSSNEEGVKEYYTLPTNASQQTMKNVDNAFKSFFALLKKKRKKDYDSKVKIPKYLPKDSMYKVIFTKIHINIRSNGYIDLSLPKNIQKRFSTKFLNFKVPSHIDPDSIKEIHLLPYLNTIKISFVYENAKLYSIDSSKTDDILSIDLGIDNLATIVSRYDNPILIDGKHIKSINRLFNKKISVLQSISKKVNNRYNTKQLSLLYDKRVRTIKDYLHKISNFIISYALKQGVKTIIIGHNKDWKRDINIGRTNNQNFLNIPHKLLIDYIQYKASMYNIEVIKNEESYTSKCDALALEPIQKHTSYLGKRVKRGLFQSSTNKLINSDVNGALNILRKAICNCDSLITEIASRGFVFNPKRIRIA